MITNTFNDKTEAIISPKSFCKKKEKHVRLVL